MNSWGEMVYVRFSNKLQNLGAVNNILHSPYDYAGLFCLDLIWNNCYMQILTGCMCAMLW